MDDIYFVGTDPLDMEASLTMPSGKSELCEIRDLPGHLYDIRFVPAEEGVHTVSLKHKGLHISGLYTTDTSFLLHCSSYTTCRGLTTTSILISAAFTSLDRYFYLTFNIGVLRTIPATIIKKKLLIC